MLKIIKTIVIEQKNEQKERHLSNEKEYFYYKEKKDNICKKERKIEWIRVKIERQMDVDREKKGNDDKA